MNKTVKLWSDALPNRISTQPSSVLLIPISIIEHLRLIILELGRESERVRRGHWPRRPQDLPEGPFGASPSVFAMAVSASEMRGRSKAIGFSESRFTATPRFTKTTSFTSQLYAYCHLQTPSDLALSARLWSDAVSPRFAGEAKVNTSKKSGTVGLPAAKRTQNTESDSAYQRKSDNLRALAPQACQLHEIRSRNGS